MESQYICAIRVDSDEFGWVRISDILGVMKKLRAQRHEEVPRQTLATCER